VNPLAFSGEFELCSGEDVLLCLTAELSNTQSRFDGLLLSQKFRHSIPRHSG
jgi:hypothetical protein